MFKIHKEEISIEGKKIILETGKIARQADASVVVTYGGTTVMSNVVAAKEEKPDIDFHSMIFHSLFSIRINSGNSRTASPSSSMYTKELI